MMWKWHCYAFKFDRQYPSRPPIGMVVASTLARVGTCDWDHLRFCIWHFLYMEKTWSFCLGISLGYLSNRRSSSVFFHAQKIQC